MSKTDLFKQEPMSKFQTEGIVSVNFEDGGMAMISENFPINTFSSDDENGMFVVLKSWDEDTTHIDLRSIVGKKVKITIEVLE